VLARPGDERLRGSAAEHLRAHRAIEQLLCLEPTTLELAFGLALRLLEQLRMCRDGRIPRQQRGRLIDVRDRERAHVTAGEVRRELEGVLRW